MYGFVGGPRRPDWDGEMEDFYESMEPAVKYPLGSEAGDLCEEVPDGYEEYPQEFCSCGEPLDPEFHCPDCGA